MDTSCGGKYLFVHQIYENITILINHALHIDDLMQTRHVIHGNSGHAHVR